MLNFMSKINTIKLIIEIYMIIDKVSILYACLHNFVLTTFYIL